jgi:peptidoglycan biosynthesis protein MviN/MurJ (putative lipid II flippase)
LALATAVASTVEAIVLFTIGQRRAAGINPRELIASASKSLVAAGIMGVVVLGVSATAAPLDRSLGGLAAVASSVVVGGAIYLGLTIAFGSTEVRQLRRLLRR